MKPFKKTYKTTPVTVEPLVAHVAMTPLEAGRTVQALRCAASEARECDPVLAAWYLDYANRLQTQFRRIFARWEYHRQQQK